MINDGHCATDAETVYVQNTAGCSPTAPAGTVGKPYCTAQAGVTAAVGATGKNVVALKGNLVGFSVTAGSNPLIIVGKGSVITPVAAGANGIDIISGTLSLKYLTVQGATGTNMGINVASGVSLSMTGCVVRNNPKGGILLNGAAFSIANTTITGNGQNTTAGALWGGIRVNSMPLTGAKSLSRVTIQNNTGPGISCFDVIQATGVLVSSNGSGDIVDCGFTSCGASSTSCGAP
jgi:hypothetical protein